MAIRYSGDVVVRVAYRDGPGVDGGQYFGRLYVMGSDSRAIYAWTFDGIRLAPIERERVSADSPEAYDRAARAAIGFCVGWCEYDDADEPVGGGPPRDVRDEVSCRYASTPDGDVVVSRRWRDRWPSEPSDPSEVPA